MRIPVTTLLGAAAAALCLASAPAAAAPIAMPGLGGGPALLPVDAFCGPGYHVGAGGRRCWPNGWAPRIEIPPGYIVTTPPVYPPPPVLVCPPGYHIGRGLRRCWPD